jgi:hypothetical protein
MRTMKIVLMACLFCSGGLYAQTVEKKSPEKNTVKVHIEKTVDGKKTLIDTTFTSTDDMAYKTFMDEHEMKVEVIEAKGKEGKTIRKEVVVKYDDKKGNQERKVVVVSPDGPIPPIPPLPPTPPGVDGQIEAFNFNWVDEDDIKIDGDGNGERIIKIRRSSDDDEFQWNMAEIDEFIKKSKPSKRMKRNKRAKKRIIIIEEY